MQREYQWLQFAFARTTEPDLSASTSAENLPTVRFKISNRHTGRSDGSRVRYCHVNFLENYRRNSSRIHFVALRPTYFFQPGL